MVFGGRISSKVHLIFLFSFRLLRWYPNVILELRYLGLLALLLLTQTLQAKQIAITFDDGPSRDGQIYGAMERSKLLLSAMKEAGVPQAVFFVNGKNIDDVGKEQLKMYAEAGHLIGNHTFKHSNLRKVTLDTYLDDIRKGYNAIKDLPGYTNLFRFPHLQEGDSIQVRDRIRMELTGLGHEHGYVTVDNYDFYMDALSARRLEAGGKVNFDALRRVYVDVLVDAVEFYDQVAVKGLGRSPKHILLLHENDLAAMFLKDLISSLKLRGWEIIPAVLAYTDPIAKELPNTLYNGQGRVAALAHIKTGKEFRSRGEDADYLDKLFKDEKVFVD